MTIDPQALFALLIGPGGLLVALSIAVWQLWQSHKRADASRDAQLERQLAVNENFASAMPVLSATVKDAAEWMRGLAQRDREDYPDTVPRPVRRASRPRVTARED